MFTPLVVLLAGMSLDEKLLDATTLTIVGMGTVLICLWLIGDIFNLLRRLMTPTPPAAASKPAEASVDLATPSVAAASASEPRAAAVKPVRPPGIEAHLIPLITAAAAMVVGRPVMVHRITFINSNTVSGWAEAGRTSIHQSHNLRRN